MKIVRCFTKENESPYTQIEFTKTSSQIKNPDGSIVFKLDDIEVPKNWSQVAADIIAQKYFRRAGVPQSLKKLKKMMSRVGYGGVFQNQMRLKWVPKQALNKYSIG